MTIEEKPPLDEALLEHFGVKGMKWGVRKSRPTSNDIRGARAMDASRRRSIAAQVDKTNLASGKAQDREAKKLSDMSMDYLKNPDRATALRLTKGEKVALTILAVGVPGIGTAAAAGTAASRVLVRKAIEKDIKKANASS
jgi:2-phosphoglycerate kinase